MSLPSPSPDATVLITGASAGIGTELARQLAARGHNLTLVARRKDRLDSLGKELEGLHGVTVDTRKCDLSVQAQRTRLINSLKDADKHVAVLCNNAGFGTFGRFAEIDGERESEMVRLNVQALVDLTAAFLPDMVSRGSGAVLNVASLAAFQPMPGNATYSATKAFVQSWSESISAELKGTGVSMTSLCPGPVETEFGEVAGVGDLESGMPDFIASTPAEVAKAGIAAMVRGRRSAYPGIPHRVVAQLGRFTPRSALLPLMARIGDRVLADR
jgi:short-subunit dehydrogenase